jgi:HK97 family phage prohead protease
MYGSSNFRPQKNQVVPAIFKCKSMQKRDGWFSGYASVFDEVDAQNDRVMRGAFLSTLHKWGMQGQFPKMLWQHESSEPIGLWHKVQEDAMGLYVEGNLLLEVQKAREAYALMKAGILDSLSIGYQVIEAIQGRKSQVRLLTQIDLFEISLVTFAANAKAKVMAIKDYFNPLMKENHDAEYAH